MSVAKAQEVAFQDERVIEAVESSHTGVLH